MRRMVILADDLSGAADCGIASASAGLKTIVALGEPRGEVIADVISIDADTRRITASLASSRMGHLARTYATDPAILLFKKIDSTLRGHLGPELAAVLQARRAGTKRALAVMAPAFPANGRTTVGGLHHVHGRPLHETEIWRNQKMTGEAYIPQMLAESGLITAHLDLATIRGSDAAVRRALTEGADQSDVVICDAETDADLRSIAEATIEFGPTTFWVGSAGLAEHLLHAAGLTGTGTVGALRNSWALHIDGPTLFVIGSMASKSKQQVAALASSGIRSITVPPHVLLAGAEGTAWPSFESELRDTIERGQDVVLVTGSDSEVELKDRTRLSLALAQMTMPFRNKVGALVASGGETARMVLDSWGVSALRLLGELEKGVSVSVTEPPGEHPLTVVTKAGDFGNSNTLVHCRELLQAKRGMHL